MNIINPTLTVNKLHILPRDYQDIAQSQFVFTNEETKEEVIVVPTEIKVNSNDIEFSIESPPFEEGERYSFNLVQFADMDYDKDTKVWSDRDVPDIYPTEVIVYRGQAFITEFSSDNYTINKDKFTVYEQGTNEKPSYNG